MSFQHELYSIADELRGLANLGLRFASDPHDRERYEKTLRASAHLIAALENRDTEEILEKYEENFAHASPLLGAESFVYQDGQVLLIQRIDDDKWALPGGLVEVGEVVSRAAIRELAEEASISGSVIDLLGIFDSRLWRSRVKSHVLHHVFLVGLDGGEPMPGPEALDAAYFSEDQLPALSPGHDTRIPHLFRILRGEAKRPHIDLEISDPSSPSSDAA